MCVSKADALSKYFEERYLCALQSGDLLELANALQWL